MSNETIPFDEYEAQVARRRPRPWFKSHSVIRAWQLNLMALGVVAALILGVVK